MFSFNSKIDPPLLGIVGPCGAGKSTLVNALKPYAITTRHIAQEHSYVASMWQKITNPRFLIFLDASYAETIRRRNLNWTMEEYLEQHRRLSHAREHADLYVFTDPLTVQQILEQVLEFLEKKAISPDFNPLPYSAILFKGIIHLAPAHGWYLCESEAVFQ